MRQSDAQLEAVAVRGDSEVFYESERKENTLVLEILDACIDAKGGSPLAFDVSTTSSVADSFVIVSGRSDRHVQGIANKVISSMKMKGVDPYSVQGLEKGHWVIVDLVDVVLHVMYEPERDRYDLESLWLDAKAEIIHGNPRNALAS